MAGNTFGHLFRLTTFGESHGPAVGGILDGCPAGLVLDTDAVQHQLDRRRPGQSALTTPRSESDRVEWLSGLFEGTTTGAPIAFLVRSTDQRSSDYDALKDVFRPGHADHSWQAKFGIRDHRGGGRSSARETIARVVGGAIAAQLLARLGVRITAYVSGVKDIQVPVAWHQLDLAQVESNAVRCPHPETAARMEQAILRARDEKDSLGGIITCVVTGMPPGWGEPVFDKLHAVLAHAVLSINATKAFEIGDGFSSTLRKGSEHTPSFAANPDGGIAGGISDGRDCWFRVGFKPVSTIGLPREGRDTAGNPVTLEPGGRHDPCVLPRAVPIVEAMTALVLADMHLLSRGNL